MKIHSIEHKKLSARDTLFIHGNLASSQWWIPTVAEWNKAGAQGDGSLVCADWRGCGKNADWSTDRAFTLRELAEDYLELLDQRGSSAVDLVGHSLGGLIAVQMMILRPEKFRKAVLLDPVGLRGVVFDDSMYDAFKQMAASRELTGQVILSTIRDGGASLPPEFKDSIINDAHKAVRGIGTSVLEILKTVNLTEAAAKIQTPVLIMHGEHDAIIPLADSEHMAQTLPNSQLEILEDGAHCWNVENAPAFVQRTREWLNS